jgi:hypothetical protein
VRPRLACFKSDETSRLPFKLEFAVGVCESGAGRGGGNLHEGMRNGLTGYGIHDGTVKGARARRRRWGLREG